MLIEHADAAAQRVRSSSNERCIAKVAASSLECMPSFSRMFWMWVRTVYWLMNRSPPIRLLSQPRLSR